MLNLSPVAFPTRYAALELLGRGSQGEVFLVEDHATGEHRALKALSGHANPSTKVRFEREFETLLTLRHPGLIRAHDFGELPDGRPYLTLDYEPAGSLARFSIPVSSSQRDVWISYLLDALAFLHSQGLLHSDIKPSNVLVGPGAAPILRLADFGLAGRLGEKPLRAGTPGYMAPEVLRGQSLDGRADLYALGVLAFELTTGQACFPGQTPDEQIGLQLRGQWNREALAAEPEFKHILERLLAVDPLQRPADAQALQSLHSAWRLADEAKGNISGELIGRHAEVEAIHAAMAFDSLPGMRLIGPPGSGRTALLRAVFRQLLTQGIRAMFFAPGVGEISPILHSRPEALLIDDFHRLTSDDLVRICEWRDSSPLVPIAAAFDDALLCPSHRSALRRILPGAQRRALGPLPAEAVRVLVQRTFPGLSRPDVEMALAESSRGRPGLLLASCCALRERRVIEPSSGGYRIKADALTLIVAEVTVDPLTARLRTLPVESQRFLWASAWIGDTSARTHCKDFAPPLRAPESLAETRAFLRDPQRLREALSEILPADDRRALAGVCSGLGDETDPLTRCDLALAAGETSAAGAFLLEAARSSSDLALWRRLLFMLPDGPERFPLLDEILRAFELAGGDPMEEEALKLRLTGPADPQARSELLRRLGWCRILRADLSSADNYLTEAVGLAAADPASTARVQADMGWLATLREDWDGARRAYKSGVESCPPGSHIIRGRLCNRLGLLERTLGNLAEAERLFQEGLRAGESVPSESLAIHCWINLLLLRQDQGRLRDVVKQGQELLEMLQDRPIAYTEVASFHYRLASAYRYLLRTDKAREHARRALSICEATGDRVRTSTRILGLAEIERSRGALAEAEALLAELPPSMGGTERTHLLLLRGEIAGERGDFAGGLRLLGRAFRLRGSRGEHGLAADALSSVLRLVAMGHRVEATQGWIATTADMLTRPLPKRTRLEIQVGRLEALFHGVGPEVVPLAELAAVTAEVEATDLMELRIRAHALGVEHALWRKDLASAQDSLTACELCLRQVEAPVESIELEAIRGLVASAQGDRGSAADLLERAVDRYTASGLRLRAERTNRRLAAVPRAGTAQVGSSPEGLLLDLGRIVHAIGSLPDLLERAMDTLLAHLPAERGAIFLLEPAKGSLDLAVARGGGVALEGEARRVSLSVLEQVAASGQTLLAADLAALPGFQAPASVLDLEIHSVLSQPLLLEERVIGVVYLDHRHRAGVFTEHHRVLLRGFCHLIAIAVDQAKLRAALSEAEAHLRAENRELRRVARPGMHRQLFVYRSPKMARLMETVAQVAPHRRSVLISGESGTGKECLAEILHAESPRAGRPLVRFNCAAVAPNLMESEMFGVEANTASGVGYRIGIFEHASGGTLFLDEVGDMDPALQAKLLRVLQDGEIRRVGGRETRHVDVRVIAATNRDLLTLVRERAFREDLLFRLNTITLAIPPLRERREDILPLAEHFLGRFADEMGIPKPGLSQGFREYLLHNSWPGNVRELRNVMERAMITQGGPILAAPEAGLVSPVLDAPALRPAAEEARDLRVMLERCAWNQSQVAKALGVTEAGVRSRMKRLGVTRPKERGPRTSLPERSNR